MQKFKAGDTVSVITGKYKGRSGKIKNFVLKRPKYVSKHLKKKPSLETWVIVEGVNMVKKHQKPNPRANQQGGIIQKEAPIHVSNVSLVNPSTGKPERVGIRILEDGKKVRYFKRSGEVLDV